MVVSGDPTTGLGADDRAGVAVVLHAALEILRRKLPHPPLTFCWTVQEEVGLQGAKMMGKSRLGGPRMAFNWDGGAPEKLTVGQEILVLVRPIAVSRLSVAVSRRSARRVGTGGARRRRDDAVALRGRLDVAPNKEWQKVA